MRNSMKMFSGNSKFSFNLTLNIYSKQNMTVNDKISCAAMILSLYHALHHLQHVSLHSKYYHSHTSRHNKAVFILVKEQRKTRVFIVYYIVTFLS